MSKVKTHLININLKAGRNELAIQIAMLDNLEGGTTTFPDGTEYQTIYLPNVYAAVKSAITPHQFAGYLSSMERQGLYIPGGDNYFGKCRTKKAS